MGQIFDWDGTITGKPGSTIVRDQPFYTSSLCESRPNWGNMSICPHQYVAAEGTGTGYTEQGTAKRKLERCQFSTSSSKFEVPRFVNCLHGI